MVNQQSAASFFTDRGTQVSSFVGRSLRPGLGVSSNVPTVSLQKDSSISATRYFAPIEENAYKPDYGVARTYGRKRKKSVLTGAQSGRY